MAYVIVEGPGTYTVDDYVFSSGANECDDETVLQRVRDAGYDWLSVQETRAPTPLEQDVVPEATPETPYDVWQGRDGKWYYVAPTGEGDNTAQSAPYDTEIEAHDAVEAAKAEAALVAPAGTVSDAPESGTLTKEDLEAKDYPCPETGCKRTFKSSGARTNHERVQKHGKKNPDYKPPAAPPAGPEPAIGSEESAV